MSNLIVPDEAELRALTDIANALNSLRGAGVLKVKLFKNDYTPVAGTTVASFTEANFTGYAATVPSDPFGTPYTNADGKAEIDMPSNVNWTASDAVTPNTIYGYWVEDTSLSKVRWAERFDAAIDMTTAAKYLAIVLRFTLRSEN